MAMTMTPWGYEVDGELPPIVTPDQFARATGGAFADAARVSAALEGTSAAIRAWCGWHVSPNLACRAVTSGPGRVIALPTLALTAVRRVTEGGEELSDGAFEWRADGLLRRCGWRQWDGAWRSVEVEFDSGLAAEAAPQLAQVACQVAANALAATPGVRSEQVGDLSVTYNQLASGVSGGVALLERDRELLAAFRLPTRA